MKYKLAAIAFLLVLTVGVVWPAPAQALPSDLDGTIGLQIYQSDSDGDEVQFFGLEPGSSGDELNQPDSELGSFGQSRPLLDALQANLGISTLRSRYSNKRSFGFYDDGVDPEIDIVSNTRQNVFAEDNGTYALDVQVALLAQTFKAFGHDDFVVGICPLEMGGSYSQTTRAPDDSEATCSYWVEASTSTERLAYSVSVETGAFWGTVGVVAAFSVGGALVLGGLAFLLRRKLSTLGTGNIVLACLGAFAAWLAVLIGFLAFYFGTPSFSGVRAG